MAFLTGREYGKCKQDFISFYSNAMISEFSLCNGNIFENAVIGMKWGLYPLFVFLAPKWRPSHQKKPLV